MWGILTILAPTVDVIIPSISWGSEKQSLKEVNSWFLQMVKVSVGKCAAEQVEQVASDIV